MAKSYRQKLWNYIQVEAIHLQSYRQLVREGMKIPGSYNSSWNGAPFFLKSSGALNCTFTLASIVRPFREKSTGVIVSGKKSYYSLSQISGTVSYISIDIKILITTMTYDFSSILSGHGTAAVLFTNGSKTRYQDTRSSVIRPISWFVW